MFKKKEKNTLTPVVQKQRPHCPFYGFQKARNTFIDTSGNGCGLIDGSHSPCKMEMMHQPNDWDECVFNQEINEDILNYITDHYKIFPREFYPKDAKSWEGMPFKDWKEYILG